MKAHRSPFSLVLPALALLAPAADADLQLSPPQFLAGDLQTVAAAGMQKEADVARGGSQFLAVWSDDRTSPDDFYPFATEGNGSDIWGLRLDATGSPVDAAPFVIDQAFGDQLEPKVAWNGQHWLVVWKQSQVALPTYEQLLGVRVAPDGTVLDAQPVVLHDDQSFYSDLALEGGAGDWVVLFQANGPVDGLLAVRIAGDGSVVGGAAQTIHPTLFLANFDLAFAGDEYLIGWQGAFDSASAQRFASNLTPIDPHPFALPFMQRVASDGTDFLVLWAAGSPPLATTRAVLVTHEGALPDPDGMVLFTAPGQAGTCCPEVTWDGSVYWASWGGFMLARVTSDGELLDPGGFPAQPGTPTYSAPQFAAAPAGGLQMVWNDGVSGAAYPKDVHGAQVDSGGAVGTPVLLSSGAPAQVDADFAEGAGVHLVVFKSRASGVARLLAQRIDSTGTSLDPEPIEVASGPTPGQGLGLPSIGSPTAAWNGSLFLVTWSDGLQVYGRRMLADGSFLDAAPLVIMDGFDPDVDAVGDVFLVAAIDFLLDNPQWQATHTMRVEGATGQALDATPNALGGFVIFAQHPHVTSWGNRWLVTWQTNISHDNPVASTRAALVDADNTTPGVIDVPLGWRPDAAVSDDFALFAAVTNSVASATTDLAGVLMTPQGTFPAPAFTISAAPDKQLMPAVSWNGSEFVVAWEDKRNAVIYFDERTDVFGARVNEAGVVLDPAGVPLAVSSQPEIDPALLSLADGSTLLAVSTFRDDASLGAFRIGIAVDGGPGGPCGTNVVSSELVRLGSPPNPDALRPGQTSGPVIGSTWDPMVDHATFMPGATIDFLGIGVGAANIPTQYGTVLCSGTPPTIIVLSPAGVPFSLALSATCDIVGISLCTQGGSWDGATFTLTNALDITIGSS